MAEVKVKLIADAQAFLRDSEDAIDSVESAMPTVKLQADTKEFSDAVKRAVDEVQRTQPAISVRGVPAQNESRLPVQQGGSGSSGLPAEQTGKSILDFLRNSQIQNTRRDQELLKAVQDVTHAIDRWKLSVENGSASGPGQNSQSSGGLFANLIGSVTGKGSNIGGGLMNMGLGSGGIMQMLNMFPGGSTLLKLLSVGGIVSLVSQAVQKNTSYKTQARGDAASAIEQAYDAMGSVRAYDSGTYGNMSYIYGMNRAIRESEAYGYDDSTIYGIETAIREGSGFDSIDKFYRDEDAVLSAARGLGADPERIAALAVTATQGGYQKRGEQGNILGVAASAIEEAGMNGRADEVVDVMKKILDAQIEQNGIVSEASTQGQLALTAMIQSRNEGMTYERANETVDSVLDWFDPKKNQSALILAGYGTAETNPEGYKQALEQWAADPVAWAQMVMEKAELQGYGTDALVTGMIMPGSDGPNVNELPSNIQKALNDLKTLNQEDYMSDTMSSDGTRIIQEGMDEFNRSGTGTAIASQRLLEHDELWTGASEQLKWQAFNEEQRSNKTVAERTSEGEWANQLDESAYAIGKWDAGAANGLYGGLDAATANAGAVSSGAAGAVSSGAAGAASLGAAGALPASAGYGAPAVAGGTIAGMTFDNPVTTPTLSDVKELAPMLTVPLQIVTTALGGAASAISRAVDKFRSGGSKSDGPVQAAPIGPLTFDDSSFILLTDKVSANTDALAQNTLAIIESMKAQVNTVPQQSASSNSAPGTAPDDAEADTQTAKGEDAQSTLSGGRNGDSSGGYSFGGGSLGGRSQGHSAGGGSLGASGRHRSSAVTTSGTEIADTPIADSRYTNAVADNTDALEENTQALRDLTGTGSSSIVTGKQEQAGLTNNASTAQNSRAKSLSSPFASSLTGHTGSPMSVQTAANSIQKVVTQSLDGDSTGTSTGQSGNTSAASGASTPNAVGNPYVPYDGYTASLHRGEMVLPKDEAELYRQGRLDDMYRSDPLTETLKNVEEAVEGNTGKGGPLTDVIHAADAVRYGDESVEHPLANLISKLDILTGREREKTAGTAADDLTAPDGIGGFLDEKPLEQTVSFAGGDININIHVTGKVEGLDEGMQRQMVESVQSAIAGSNLQDMLSNGFTRRQNW